MGKDFARIFGDQLTMYANDNKDKQFFKQSERWAESQTNLLPATKHAEPSTPVLTMQTELAKELANPQGVKL